MRKRDLSLDAIKGLACVFMVFAHAYWPSWSNIAVAKLSFVGNFAPVLFLAVTGITSTFQAKRNSFYAVSIFYSMFAALGLSMSAASNPDLFFALGSDLCNVLQVIAIGAAITFVIEKFFKPAKSSYLILAVSVYLVHHLLYTKLLLQFSFPIWPFVFASQDRENLFPTAPWISFCFLGVYSHYSTSKHNLCMSLCSLISLIFYELFIYVKYPEELAKILTKFPIDPGYFILSACVLFLSFYLSKSYSNSISEKNVLVYLGSHSLLFFYVHTLVFDVLRFVCHNIFKDDSPNAFIAWTIILILSLVCINTVQAFNKYVENFFDVFGVWLFLFIAIFTTAIIAHLYIKDARYIQYLFGAFFACNYQKLSSMLKKQFPAVDLNASSRNI